MGMARTMARKMQREKYGTNKPRKLRRVVKTFTVPAPAPESVTHPAAPPAALSQSPERDKAEDPAPESVETTRPSRRKASISTLAAMAMTIAGSDTVAALDAKPAKPRKPRTKKTAE